MWWRRLFRFLGPVFVYDLVRSARRHRTLIFRVLYCSLLFAVLLWTAYAANLGKRETLQSNELATLAHQFFATFMVTQFVVLALATPAYVAGAITEEKERQTLPYLLTTDLTDREIVLGKMASRLVHVAMYLLAGLPILSALQVLGGVDPELVLAGFAATAVTVLSLGALSIFSSVALRKTRDALIATYAAGGGYLVLSGMLVLLARNPSVGTFPSTEGWASPVTLADVADWLAVANVVVEMSHLFQAAGGAPTSVVLVLLARYVLSHVLIMAVFSAIAVLRLRSVEQTETVARTTRHRLWTRIFGRPAVGDDPMVWKEVHVEAGFRQPLLARLLVLGLVVLSFVPVVGIFLTEHGDKTVSLNIWVRSVGTAVGCLLIVSAAVRAAGSISTERERQTLETLLTTPMEAKELLFGKWLGSLVGLRWGWFWLGSIYLVGVATGGVSPLAIPFVGGVWFVYGAFFTMLGLWFGVTCKKTVVATLGTVLATVILGGGHWFVTGFCCFMPLVMGGGGSRGALWVLMMLVFGLTPPATLATVAFRGEDFEMGGSYEPIFFEMMGCAGITLVAWGIAAYALWNNVCSRFQQQYRPDPPSRT